MVKLLLKLKTRTRKAIAGLEAIVGSLVGVLIAVYIASQVGSQLQDNTTQSIYNKIMTQVDTWAPIVFLIGFATVAYMLYKKSQG